MAQNGFTSIQVSDAANSLIEQLQAKLGGQKRDLISSLLIGLLISEQLLIETILNAGKMGNQAFTAGVSPRLAEGITFPTGHFMEGFSATMTIDKLCAAKTALEMSQKALDANENQEREETPKRKK